MEYVMEALDSALWEKSNPAQHTEFITYMIIRHKKVGDGKDQYAVRDNEGNGKIVTLEGALRENPLKGIANCELIVKGDAITGINVIGDCAVRRI